VFTQNPPRNHHKLLLPGEVVPFAHYSALYLYKLARPRAPENSLPSVAQTCTGADPRPRSLFEPASYVRSRYHLPRSII